MKTKKIKLNKVTVASLNSDEMYNIRGASIYISSYGCNETKSCSIYIDCCKPPENLVNNEGI
jgi:natural product precursor